MGAGQIAQQAKCLLYKNKDLKLSPQYLCKAGSGGTPICLLSIRGVETGGSQDLAGWLVCPNFSKRPCVKGQGEKQ